MRDQIDSGEDHGGNAEEPGDDVFAHVYLL
jgi:hypothetical protein